MPARPNFFDPTSICSAPGAGPWARLRGLACALSSFGAWVAAEVDRSRRLYRPPCAPDPGGLCARRKPAIASARTRAGRRSRREAYRRGVVGLNYGEAPAPFLLTFAMGYPLSQADVSLHCPVTMTGAVAYILSRHGPAAVRERYLPRLTRRDGAALTGGTWATEKHGGSDIGATTTVARREGDHHRLTGLKWFASNANGGLGAGDRAARGRRPGNERPRPLSRAADLGGRHRDPLRFRRLKDKLGTTGIPDGGDRSSR